MLLAVILAQCSCSYVPAPVSFGGSESYGDGLSASIDTYNGLATGGPVVANLPGRGVELVSRRTDNAPGVIIRSTRWVDGGAMLQVNAHNCGNSSPAFSVTPEGVYLGNGFNPDCTLSTDVFNGGLIDNAGASGHVALRRAPGHYLHLAGHLGTWDNCALLPNGEHPNPANYPAGWVATAPDGGTCFPYAGLHGSNSLGTVEYQRAGFLVTFDNAGHPVYPHRGGIDHNGGYFQSHWMTREQFPSPLVETTMTSLGQFRYMMASTQMYAFDTKRWYFSDGTTWRQFAEQSDVNDRLTLIEARLAALEASCP